MENYLEKLTKWMEYGRDEPTTWKDFLPLLKALGTVAVLIGLLLALAGCAATADLPTVLSAPVDSSVARQVAALRQQLVHTGRVKFKGPVTLQIGGAGNTGTSTDATKAKAPVAAAPHAAASETKTSAGLPWWGYLGGGLLLLGAGFALHSRLKLP